ncbi:MAG: hypothetical protein PWQ48_92 [Thermotogaceae bacterium]|nr:hypothetical protein [Thermotogaceae bacterium]
MKPKLLLLFLTSLVVLIFLSGCIAILMPRGTLKLYVVEYNAGKAVSNASVELYNPRGALRASGMTDENGYFEKKLLLSTDPSTFTLIVKKDGYALSKVVGLGLTSLKDNEYEIQLRKATVGTPSSDDILQAEINFYTDETKTTPVDFSNLSEDPYFEVNVDDSTAEFGVKYIYVKAGGTPGSGFLTNPRSIFESTTSASGTLSLDGLNGLTEIHVVIYDHNDDRVDYVFYANVSKISSPVQAYIVEDGQITAYTRRAAIGFYSEEPITKAIDFEGNLWIEVSWTPWEDSSSSDTTDEPEGYAIYRSFDGINYEKIGVVPSSYSTFKDGSAQLDVGKRTYYKVSAVYPGYEGTATYLGDVVPLDMFNVELLTPANNATNVSRAPTFSWKVTNELTSPEGTPEYWYDLWMYDYTQNENWQILAPVVNVGGNLYLLNFGGEDATQVSVDFSDHIWYYWALGTLYPYPQLQGNKTYCWGVEYAVAQVTDPNDNSVAKSIAIDLGKDDDPFGLEPDFYNTFITGSN